jgi:hypothetical protein
MNNVLIYTLTCPIDNIVRYVGKTTIKNFNNRYRSHCNPHQRADKNKHKYNWLSLINKNGLKPIIEIIDEIPNTDWQIHEKYWIQQFRQWGFPLVNISDGGDNPPPCKGWTLDNRKKLIQNRKDKISISAYKDNVKIGDFDGINIFIRDYLKLDRYENKNEFNLWSSKISAIINGKRKTHKNYSFMVI